MKYQVLFSLKNNEKVYINVVCCSRDWHLRVKRTCIFQLSLVSSVRSFNSLTTSDENS